MLYKTDKILKHWSNQEIDYTKTAAEGEYWPQPVTIKETFMNPD
jgi:hypothetical protein